MSNNARIPATLGTNMSHPFYSQRASVTRVLIATSLLFCMFAANAMPRDRSQLAAFKRAHPCPVTGSAKGACPGWEVDHVVPLKCGGADRPRNMQWLTKAAHKIKTKREVRRCRHPR